MKNKTKLFSNLYLVIIMLFIYIPIISLVVFSFNEGRSLTQWTGFSFQWYGKLFSDRDLMDAVMTTIIVAVISTVISTIIGTMAAIGLSKQRKIVKDTFLGINNIPILSPEIITAIALFIFFGAFAIEYGMVTLLLAHIAFSTPYVILAVYPKIMRLDENLIDAAYDLGATPAQGLIRVIIPQIKDAIIAGAAIAFTMSFDDFIISYFASNSTIKNISIYLYTLKRGIEPSINALSTFIVLIIGIKVLVDYLKSRKIILKEED